MQLPKIMFTLTTIQMFNNVMHIQRTSPAMRHKNKYWTTIQKPYTKPTNYHTYIFKRHYFFFQKRTILQQLDSFYTNYTITTVMYACTCRNEWLVYIFTRNDTTNQIFLIHKSKQYAVFRKLEKFTTQFYETYV